VTLDLLIDGCANTLWRTIMKKGLLLNAPLNAVIAECGHTDQICLCDAGLPIPAATQRIDLALKAGVPDLLETTQVVCEEMVVERVILAEELPRVSPECHDQLLQLLQQAESKQGKPIQIEYIPHEAFKQQTHQCKAVVRTGEVTPYANLIICAGVAF
jgi:ABC-type ribose transport system, auxiliary component